MIGIVLKVNRRIAKDLEGKEEDILKLITTFSTVMFLPMLPT